MSKRKKPVNNVAIGDAEIIFRNFSGIPSQYNRAGQPGFTIVLRPEMADRLRDEGWYVKELKQREEGEPVRHGISVAFSFDAFPPKILQVSERTRAQTILNSETVKNLDAADIVKADIVIRPYNWKMDNGTEGTKAYLSAMYVTIQEDEFAERYSNETPAGSVPLDGIPEND